MFKSLRLRLTITMIAIAVIPIIVVSAIVSSQGYNQLQEAVVASERLVIDSVEANILDYIDQHIARLTVLDETLNITGLNRTEQNSMLSNLLAQDQAFQNLYLLNADGNVILQVNRYIDGGRIVDEFQTSPVNSSIELSRVHFDEQTGEPLITVRMPVVNLRTGEIEQVLLADLRWSPVWDILANFDFADEQIAYVMDDTNRVIAHPNPSIVLAGTSFIPPQSDGRTQGLSGDDVILSLHELVVNNRAFTVIAEQEFSVATAVASGFVLLTVFASGIIFVIAVIIATIVAIRLVKPINELSDVATTYTGGDFSKRVDLKTNDEIGQLGRVFNAMAGQVQDLIANLEERVAARTADLATSAEIASAANQIRERDELISLTVNLIRDRFDFYYVQAYLIDEAKEYAVLSDGTGYAGRRLLGRDWKLPLNGQSLVANTIKSGTVTVVQDTINDPDWLANELLPDTRSEIVVPLRIQDNIIGVLDIQHNVPDSFDESQQQLFQTLADQLGVTFENVNLLADTEQRAKRLATVSEVAIEASTERDMTRMLRSASQLTRENFGLYHAHVYLANYESNRMELVAGAGEAGLEMVANQHRISLDNHNSIVVRAVHNREPVIVNDIMVSGNFLPNPFLPDTHAELAVPMIVGERVIGVLDVQDERIARFTTEDAQVLQILAAQLAVAVDNIQILERAEQSARELDRIFNSTIDMLGSANFDGYFVQLNDAWQETVGWTKEELMAEPFINFVHPDDVEGTLAASQEANEGSSIFEFTNRYRTKRGDFIWISWKASTDLEAERINFVARDVTEQLRNEADIQRRATKMQAVTEITTEIGNILDINELLWDVVNLTQGKNGSLSCSDLPGIG